MEFFIQNIIVGIAVGGIYGLIALGFVLIYKSTGVLNVSQGGLMTIGAFICYTFSTKIGVPFTLAIVLTVLVSFFIGIFINRIFFRPMIGQPLFSHVMMTLALLFILEGIVMSVWGAHYYKFPQLFPKKPITLGSFVLSYELLVSFILAGLLTAVFILFFRFSRIGIKMRAVSEDQQASQAAGVKVKTIFMLSWGIGTVIANLGGISLGMITMVFYGLSFSGLKVLPVVILGGMESILGAIIGGLIIGVMESLTGAYIDPYIKGSKEIAPFIILIIFLLIRPYGLFGLKRIERI
jgi:branched-chain amino acid transport system permease protein